jgi:hypothetical protein
MRSVARFAVMLVAASVVITLAGCGDKDPFVGKWRAVGAGEQAGYIVIAATDEGYTHSRFIPGYLEADGITPMTNTIELIREGDTLVSEDAKVLGLTLEYTYLPESGRLSAFSAGALGPPGSALDSAEPRTQEYERISDSTEIPGVR